MKGALCFMLLKKTSLILITGGRIVILSSRRYYEAEFDGYGQKLAAAILNQESRGLWKIEKQEEVAYHGPYKACISYVTVQ